MPTQGKGPDRGDFEAALSLVEETQTENKVLKSELMEIRAEIEKLKAPQSGDKIIRDDKPVARHNEETFLGAKYPEGKRPARPTTEFFGFGSRNFVMTLFNEKKDKNDPSGLARPALQIRLSHWKQAGSDIKDPPFVTPICHVDIANHPMVTVSKEDVAKYSLDNPSIKESEFTIEECLERIYLSPAFKMAHIVQGDRYRDMVEDPIRMKWENEDRAAKHRRKLEEYDPRRIKAANEPELVKALS